MTSSNSEESDKKYSGNELDELNVEESDSIQEENISGNELDEPRIEESDSSQEENISGNELDELNVEESDSIQEEKSDSELELDELEVSYLPPIGEEENPKEFKRKHRGDKKVTLFFALGLCLLIGIGYTFLKEKVFDILKKEETTHASGLKIPEDQLLLFNSFVIPLNEKIGLTYISLNISFNVPNKVVRQEIIEKKEQLRGIMYDILREEINRREKIPPLKTIKGFLINRINMALSAGKVNEVYITKFLAV